MILSGVATTVVSGGLLQILQIPGPAASSIYALRHPLRASVTRRREVRRGAVVGAIAEDKVRIGAGIVVGRARHMLSCRQRTQRWTGRGQSLRIVGNAMISQSTQCQVSHSLDAVVNLMQLLQILFCGRKQTSYVLSSN